MTLEEILKLEDGTPVVWGPDGSRGKVIACPKGMDWHPYIAWDDGQVTFPADGFAINLVSVGGAEFSPRK